MKTSSAVHCGSSRRGARRCALGLAALAGVVAIAACKPTVASLVPSSELLEFHAVNESAQLAVTARDKLGVELKGIPLMMTSSDPAVASVDSGGTVVALRSGETRIVITADQARAEVPVKVAVFAALKADAPSLDLAVGEAKTPEVQILNEAGAPINGTVRWDSSDDAVASVNTSGYITGVAPGSAKLTGKAGSASISIDVSVRPRGKTP